MFEAIAEVGAGGGEGVGVAGEGEGGGEGLGFADLAIGVVVGILRELGLEGGDFVAVELVEGVGGEVGGVVVVGGGVVGVVGGHGGLEFQISNFRFGIWDLEVVWVLVG